jgi:hypothetical protein
MSLSGSYLLHPQHCEIDQQKRNFLSDISDMHKSFNNHLDKIEKQTVEEMVSVEQNSQYN